MASDYRSTLFASKGTSEDVVAWFEIVVVNDGLIKAFLASDLMDALRTGSGPLNKGQVDRILAACMTGENNVLDPRDKREFVAARTQVQKRYG